MYYVLVVASGLVLGFGFGVGFWVLALLLVLEIIFVLALISVLAFEFDFGFGLGFDSWGLRGSGFQGSGAVMLPKTKNTGTALRCRPSRVYHAARGGAARSLQHKTKRQC